MSPVSPSEEVTFTNPLARSAAAPVDSNASPRGIRPANTKRTSHSTSA